MVRTDRKLGFYECIFMVKGSVKSLLISFFLYKISRSKSFRAVAGQTRRTGEKPHMHQAKITTYCFY
ncbi:Uncharacterized protein dnm_003010 [Desulfonema magnum]|uniref:Uncharacterized protein n=1 Tax=Desulfonema magnum TaxID=45655 RepID=A0A975BF02_9BACT|nr:Uncharacterized protein dnm_003010 [Desulfonema magnum]